MVWIQLLKEEVLRHKCRSIKAIDSCFQSSHGDYYICRDIVTYIHFILEYCISCNSGSEKGVFWKRGLFRKVHFLEILENLEILEILENPPTVENIGEADHFPEILETLEILEILEISAVKRPLS